MKIKIACQGLELKAELYQKPTAQKISEALPLQGRVSRWGDEIYFEIPVKAELEVDARAEVEVGELGYWPEGRAFCIFFGRTPASADAKPKAYSAVNIIGKLLKLPREALKAVKPGTTITIEQA